MADCHAADGAWEDAIRYRQSAAKRYRALAEPALDRETRAELAMALWSRQRFAEGDAAVAEALAIQSKDPFTDELHRAGLLLALAGNKLLRGDAPGAARATSDAEKRLLATLDRLPVHPTNHAKRSTCHAQLDRIYRSTGAWEKAIPLLERRQGELTVGSEEWLEARADLGALHGLAGAFDLSRNILTDVIQRREKQRPVHGPRLVQATNSLVSVLQAMGEIDESRALASSAVEACSTHHVVDPRCLAQAANNRAYVWVASGQYARGIDEYRRAMAICDQAGSELLDLRVGILKNLSIAYRTQGQFDSAARHCAQAMDACREHLGSDAFDLAHLYNALADLELARGRPFDAEKSVARAWRLCELHRRRESPVAGHACHLSALIARLQGKYATAEGQWKQALAIQKACGQKPMVSRTLGHLAELTRRRGDLRAAEQLFREALEVQDALADSYPAHRFLLLSSLGELRLEQGDEREGMDLLLLAIETAETPRLATTGAERGRATFFAQFASAYDRLIEASMRAGDLDQAFSLSQRSRNRTFLDQLTLVGLDPREGLAGPKAKDLLAAEKEAQKRLSRLRNEARRLPPRSNSATIAELKQRIHEAQSEFGRIRDEIMDANPAFRQLLARRAEADPIAVAREQVKEQRTAILAYYLGSRCSYLFFLAPRARSSREVTLEVFPLMVPAKFANGDSWGKSLLSIHVGPRGGAQEKSAREQALATNHSAHDSRSDGTVESSRGPEGTARSIPGIREPEAGDESASATVPLTRELAHRLVIRFQVEVLGSPQESTRAPVGIVSSPLGTKEVAPERDPVPTDSPVEGSQPSRQAGDLAWADLFVPREVRARIAEEEVEYVTILPDGALHQLPFEALPVQARPAREYLMDHLPPIAYCATMTAHEEPNDGASSPLSILTVGNPHYARATADSPSVADVTREAFIDLGGRLTPLPGTSAECRRVARLFPADRVTLIEGKDATESRVRAHLAGKSILHLAAHGLVDEQNENLFGAIALTPPTDANADTTNDGFLSLHEIHSLALRGCRLAVLSACQTNVGPERPLEAGSSLARAFLAAGAQRVVASHWSVSDDSTTELIGTFFEEVTRNADGGTRNSYVHALQLARRKVRAKPEWSAPYHWAPFVLLQGAAFPSPHPERSSDAHATDNVRHRPKHANDERP